MLYTGSPGPLSSGLTIVYYVYRNAFERYRMGVPLPPHILFAIIFVFTLIQMYASASAGCTTTSREGWLMARTGMLAETRCGATA